MELTNAEGRPESKGKPSREYNERVYRIVHDEDGHLWRVREVRFADANPSLIFESEVSFRRVRSYPRDWHLLDDQSLYALSWRT